MERFSLERRYLASNLVLNHSLFMSVTVQLCSDHVINTLILLIFSNCFSFSNTTTLLHDSLLLFGNVFVNEIFPQTEQNRKLYMAIFGALIMLMMKSHNQARNKQFTSLCCEEFGESDF